MSDEARGPAGDEIVTECELDAAPEKVWRALTVPELVEAWLLPNDLKPEIGAEFSLVGDSAGLGHRIACKVLAVTPNSLLRYSWREGADEPGRDAAPHRDTVVSFHLSRTDAGGTRLRIVHNGPAVAALPNKAITMMAANCNAPLGLRRAA